MGKRIAIVGAGPGGLAAAMLLARTDAEVTLIERRDTVGGRTSALEQDGFRFDVGPTFFLYPQVLSDIFAQCGFDLGREVEMTRLDPQYRLVFEGGGKIDATADIARLQAEVARFSAADAAALPRFMADNRRKLKFFKPVLERPFNSVLDCLSPDMLRALPLLRPTLSVDAELGRYFSDPRVRLAFSFQSKYLGMSPFNCPSLFTILSFLEYEYGVFHPKGGCAAVTRRMMELARSMGVRVRLGEPVKAIQFSGRRATGITTDAGTYEADAVVVNADFAQAMASLVPDRLRRRWTDAKLERKRYSCSTFMLYLGLDTTLPELPHHTIFLADGYRQNIAQIEGGVLPDAPSFYVQNASVTDPTLAPAGKSALYVLVPVPHRSEQIDWAREAPAFRRVALQQLAKIGLGDIEKHIVSETMLTPADWEAQHAIYRGATFNLAHTLGQMLHLRPRNRFDELDGVYLVGGGTHPGSGLPVIFESARITTRLMERDLGLRNATTPVSDRLAPAMAGAD